MSLHDLELALEPARRAELPFAAGRRLHPPRRRTPVVSHLFIEYRQWDGPKLSWSEDFGKGRGQVYARDGKEPVRSCNEVEVGKALRRVRENAVWVSSYLPARVPQLWRPWTIGPAQAPGWLTRLDRAIRGMIPAPKGGIPDVVAWSEEAPLESALFVECKGETEDFKEAQEDWVAAAIEAGVRADQFAVAVRTFR